MLPTIATLQAQPPVQTTLVATQIPDTNTLRAPYDNVAPSVSSAQIRDNARGNGSVAAPMPDEVAQAPPQANAPTFSIPAFYSTSPGLSAGAQTNFLAQLLAQQPDGENSLAGMMIEYEKLVVFSRVKYKPSNATLPPPQPSGLFGKLLQQESAPVRDLPPPVQVAEPVEAAPPVADMSPRVSDTAPVEDNGDDNGFSFDVPAASAPVAVIHAYQASSARNDAVEPTTEDSA